MIKHFKKSVSLLLVLLLLLSVGVGCSSDAGDSGQAKDNYPTKPIELIVPAFAGGGTDLAARALGNEMEKILGKGIGVLNKPGASGSVGMTEGANAKADGYTATMVFVELTMYKHLGLSPLTHDEFKPVAMVNFDPAALTVPIDAPYDTIEEFIEYAKEHPGEISVGNAGTGSIWHIAAANLEKGAGIELNHVPHEGAAPAVTALVGGHIDAVTVSPAEVKAQLEAGNVKVLGVMADERSDLVPDVPTFKEEGVDLQSVGTWRGITLPKDTPDEIVEKLEKAVLEAAESEGFKEFMDSNGLGIEIKTAKEFEAFMEENEKLFGDIIKDLGL
ncbi:MAG: tripartite tricarboxylate transporter substrate binding protein [Thermotaleaceae bacterium]